MWRHKRSWFVGLLAVAAVLWVVWPRSAKEPVFRLLVVREAVEQGKAVVFFRVEVPDRRRIQLSGAQRVAGNKTNDWREFPPNGSNGFWAPSQAWPMGDPAKALKPLGILAPTNTSVWKARIYVYKEIPSQTRRIAQMPSLWWGQWRSGMMGKSVGRLTRDVWGMFFSDGGEWVESEPLTNHSFATSPAP